MKNMKPIAIGLASLLLTWAPEGYAKKGEVVLRTSGTNALVQVQGGGNDDWRLEASPDFVHWTNVAGFGTLLSGGTNAPWRSLGVQGEPARFFRTVKTSGLYDPSLLRTVSLTFTQANWSTLLASAHDTTNYVYGSLLFMDNGATNVGIGARYRGNTSFTMSGTKKSVAIAIDYGNTNADLMGYTSINLNNAFGDESIMREAVYFTIMRNYTVCPAGCMARLIVNGADRGVYSQAQQQNGDLIRDYFPSNDGYRFRAANMDGSAAFVYLGNTNVSTYTPHYELKSDYDSNAWPRFIHAISVFNSLPLATIRDTAEDVIAVDRWLWFLALENLFVDDDSYFNKGSDYMLYYEPESGRVHPVEHDGNEAFATAQSLNASLAPLYNSTSTGRPILYRLLSNAELKQRYLAHMRTAIEEWYNPTNAIQLVDQFVRVSSNAIYADPIKGFTMAAYTSEITALKTFITNRWRYLTVTSADLKPVPPIITQVSAPTSNLAAGQVPFVNARVQANGTNGLDSVWLYHRGKSYGKFVYSQMFDDGAHGDGDAGDGIFGGATTNYPAGAKVRFYVEARSANSAKAACFSPPRAEQETWSYRVALTSASNTPVVINEIMASNSSSLADPQGEYDDWIELRNLTSQEVDLTGHYLSDEPGNPRKWQFPAGTTIPADGYLIVWADEDGKSTSGLHASFKLSASGEQLYLVDTDEQLNAILDYIAFGQQTTDISYGRSAADGDIWEAMTPTPGSENR
jgi:spore coat protein CotH